MPTNLLDHTAYKTDQEWQHPLVNTFPVYAPFDIVAIDLTELIYSGLNVKDIRNYLLTHNRPMRAMELSGLTAILARNVFLSDHQLSMSYDSPKATVEAAFITMVQTMAQYIFRYEEPYGSFIMVMAREMNNWNLVLTGRVYRI